MHPQHIGGRRRSRDIDDDIQSDERGGGYAGLDEPPRDPRGPQYLGAQQRHAERVSDAVHNRRDYGYGGYGHMGQGDLYSPGGLGTRQWDAFDYRRTSAPHPEALRDPMPARFRGMGPKNWARSDERILEEVCERLSDADIDASEIEVTVQGGEVTLAGTVPDRRSKHDAEDIACHARGVKDCHNRLRVGG